MLIRGIRWRYANGTVVTVAFSSGGLRRMALEMSAGKVFTHDEIVDKFGTALPIRRAVMEASSPATEDDLLQVRPRSGSGPGPGVAGGAWARRDGGSVRVSRWGKLNASVGACGVVSVLFQGRMLVHTAPHQLHTHGPSVADYLRMDCSLLWLNTLPRPPPPPPTQLRDEETEAKAQIGQALLEHRRVLQTNDGLVVEILFTLVYYTEVPLPPSPPPQPPLPPGTIVSPAPPSPPPRPPRPPPVDLVGALNNITNGTVNIVPYLTPLPPSPPPVPPPLFLNVKNMTGQGTLLPAG